MNLSLEDFIEHRSTLLVDIIFPIGIYVGILVNIVAIFIWTFGPKSRSICCATYFAANAVADFLTLSFSGLWIIICFIHFNTTCYYSARTCKIFSYLQIVLFQASNWISTTITVERALTIMFPLKFRSNDMRRHSKYAIPIIVILVLLGNIPSLYAIKLIKGTIYCQYSYDFNTYIYILIEISVRSLLPFITIVTFNCCTIATLCKQRRNPVSTNQERYVNVFTRLTLLTGLSFVISNTIGVAQSIIDIFGFEHILVQWNDYMLFLDLSIMMCYFNCLMNPIISVVICKSMQEDMKSFLQRLLRACRREQHDITL